MVTHETPGRVRCLHECRRAHHGRPETKDAAARRRVQKAGGSESAKTWAKAKRQALRLEPRASPALTGLRFFSDPAGKSSLGESPSSDPRSRYSPWLAGRYPQKRRGREKTFRPRLQQQKLKRNPSSSTPRWTMKHLLAMPKSALDRKARRAKIYSPRAGNPNAPGRKPKAQNE